MKKVYKLVAVMGVFFLFTPVWSAGKAQESGSKIIVASKIDTEGALLGSMIVQVLSANGFNVVDKTEFGTTDVIRTAIKNG